MSITHYKHFIEKNLISLDKIKVAEKEADLRSIPFDQALKGLGFLGSQPSSSEEVLNLRKVLPNRKLLEKFPKHHALAHHILPLALEDNVLVVATCEDFSLETLDCIRYFLGTDIAVDVKKASQAEIEEAIDLFYYTRNSFQELLEEINPKQEAFLDTNHSPIVRLVNAFLQEGVLKKASDIHFEPSCGFITMHHRLDGDLHPIFTFHQNYWAFLVIRLKVLASLNITESRKPQSGSFSLRINGRDVDFRLSTHPTIHGESLVIRVLDKTHSLKDLDDLGFDQEDKQSILRHVAHQKGLIIFTGPTGSGKTTTLYSILQRLRSSKLNIMTLEQPVEYKLDGLRQCDIQQDSEIDFAEGIRSILRQDPDIILIGEVRDDKTAQMMLRAAITGHQVFTTLHTQDVFGVIPRLKELGVNPSMIEGHLSLIISQRLIKRLCDCKEIRSATPYEKSLFRDNGMAEPEFLAHPKGCSLCQEKGVSGRFAIAEILDMSFEQGFKHATYKSIKEEAQKKGFKTLLEKGLKKVFAHETYMQEVLGSCMVGS